MPRQHGKLSTTRTATALMMSAAKTKRSGRSGRGGRVNDDADADAASVPTNTSTTRPCRRRVRVRIMCKTAVAAAATSALVMMLVSSSSSEEEEEPTCVPAAVALMDAAVATILWSTSQILRSALPYLLGSGVGGGAGAVGLFERTLGRMEGAAWTRWERRAALGRARRRRADADDPPHGGGVGAAAEVSKLPIPVLDFACPGDDVGGPGGPRGVAGGYYHCIDWEEECAKFRSAAVAGGRYDLWERLGLALDRPILLRNVWNATITTNTTEAGTSTGGSGSFHPLTLLDLTRPPLGNLSVPFYSDSSRSGADALRPDMVAPLSSVAYNVTTDGNSTRKIGTQIPVLSQPELIYRVAPPEVVRYLFGDRFRPEHVEAKLGGLLPAWTTVPIFLARGLATTRRRRHDDGEEASRCRGGGVDETESQCGAGDRGRGGRTNSPDDESSAANVRTDLHCEPIGNVAVQLHGERRWTLISPRHSHRLRPTVSRHSRAFFHSTLDPSSLDDPADRRGPTSNVPRYEVVTTAGDAVWVPPWTWHRIDYVPGMVSMGASLFHFRPLEFVRNNPLFAALVLPNLVKELVQMKTE